MSYATARRDFEYLETLGELDDQVGLDSMRLDLMRNPTKAVAADMYVMGIRRWFEQHGILDKAPRVAAIRERYGI